MKFLSNLLFLCLVISLSSCQEKASGTLIKGQLKGAENLQVSLEELMVAKPPKQRAVTPVANDGTFAMGFVDGLEPGVYQLRIGAQSTLLAIDEDDHKVTITGALPDLNTYNYQLTGSEDTEQIRAAMKDLLGGQLTEQKVKDALDGIDDPSAAAILAYTLLGRSGNPDLSIHKAILERLPADNRNKPAYAKFVQTIGQQQASRQASERIQVGQPAPDIALESPDGKTYRLSDLKGQVVLLDFWASWCRPCRAENPNVVKVYNKYKDDGFTIYSVSLDGLDARRTANMDAHQIARATENSKQRWVDAIQKDNLVWPYHVSELKKWDSTAGRSYGVRGIPRTFLIDRDGNIAAVGLRGAAAIEQALQDVI